MEEEILKRERGWEGTGWGRDVWEDNGRSLGLLRTSAPAVQTGSRNVSLGGISVAVRLVGDEQGEENEGMLGTGVHGWTGRRGLWSAGPPR